MTTHNKEEIFITNSFEETRKVGEEFIQRVIRPGLLRPKGQALQKEALIIALHGELGAGKTTFAQGLAKGLKIKRRIISPTFIIVRIYRIKTDYSSSKQSASRSSRQALTINFYHIDLYRIENQKDIEGLGVEEILRNPENIVVVEWAERLGDLLPKKRVDVYFEYLDEKKRKIIYDFRY